MNYCRKCHVIVDMSVKKCPLCSSTLQKKEAPRISSGYPKVSPISGTQMLLLKILMFLTIATAILCVVINILTFNDNWWSVIVIGCMVFGVIMIITAIRKAYANIGLYAIIQAILICLLCIIIDKFTYDYRWALNYVVPGMAVITNFVILITSIIRFANFKKYTIYQVTASVLGYIPLILYFLKKMDVLLFAVIPALVSTLIIVALIIFGDRATNTELKKRLHL